MFQSKETIYARLLMVCVGLLLISTCISYQEAAYLINGHDAEADVTKVYESRGRRVGTSLTVEYAFTEPHARKGMESVPLDWESPRNGKVPVRYTPGEDGSSRFAGRVRWVGVGIFAVAFVFMLAVAIRLLLEGADDKPRRRTR